MQISYLWLCNWQESHIYSYRFCLSFKKMELGLIKLIALGAEMNEEYEWLERSKNKDSVCYTICIQWGKEQEEALQQHL